jgi:hypothetical protein
MEQGSAPPRTIESWLLAGCGVWLLGLGLYFGFLRPAMLPEDFRFIGLTPEALTQAAPGLQVWLRRVFAVMGGFMFGGGVLTLYMSGQPTRRWVHVALWLFGLSTVGLMSAINFAIDSDFKWILLAPALGWLAALCLSGLRPRENPHA